MGKYVRFFCAIDVSSKQYSGANYGLTCGVDTGVGGFPRGGISLHMRKPPRLIFYLLHVRDWFSGGPGAYVKWPKEASADLDGAENSNFICFSPIFDRPSRFR